VYCTAPPVTRHWAGGYYCAGRLDITAEEVIRHSLMDSDVPYITLRTPPPSPGPRILLGEITPTPALSHASITPTQKRCVADTRLRKKPHIRRTVVEDDDMQEQAPSWDSAGADLDMGSKLGWSSPKRPRQSLETDTDIPQDLYGVGYSEYCDNIQEEGGAFYQIGADLFVVNGWDPQTPVNTIYHLQLEVLNTCCWPL
jgi:hypothetical protein